jgi:EAL domain-containing protein (putative c-di-GMP-specific phosphodiesterase class I)
MPVAVNLSARQISQQNMVAGVADVLRQTGLDPRWLELEITESMLMEQTETATVSLSELDAMGIHITIDDFGTGYSSLSYLKRFPISSLKIDRSFVKDIMTDHDNAAIASAVIAMAHSLKMPVIAEGVETAGQLEFLRAHGCDEIQGFYFGKPLPPNEFAQLLKTNPRLAAAPAQRVGSA